MDVEEPLEALTPGWAKSEMSPKNRRPEVLPRRQGGIVPGLRGKGKKQYLDAIDRGRVHHDT